MFLRSQIVGNHQPKALKKPQQSTQTTDGVCIKPSLNVLVILHSLTWKMNRFGSFSAIVASGHGAAGK